MATVVHNHLRGSDINPEEVQVAHHDGRLHIAANTNRANRAIREAFGERSAGEVLREQAATAPFTDTAHHAARIGRHQQKLLRRSRGDVRYGEIRESLGRAVVVPDDVTADLDGLHAERRLRRHLGDSWGDAAVAGTRRPCAICHQEAYGGAPADHEHHPQTVGPLWTSGAATKGTTASPDYVRRLSAKPTSVTMSRPIARKRYLTVDYDTESDSEPGSESAGGAPSSSSAARTSTDEAGAQMSMSSSSAGGGPARLRTDPMYESDLDDDDAEESSTG